MSILHQVVFSYASVHFVPTYHHIEIFWTRQEIIELSIFEEKHNSHIFPLVRAIWHMELCEFHWKPLRQQWNMEKKHVVFWIENSSLKGPRVPELYLRQRCFFGIYLIFVAAPGSPSITVIGSRKIHRWTNRRNMEIHHFSIGNTPQKFNIDLPSTEPTFSKLSFGISSR